MFNTKLDNLIKHTGNGVFALINDSDRKVDVRYGTSLFRSIAVLVESFKNNSVQPLVLIKDLQKLELVILETNISSPRVCHGKWINHYKNLGYELYRTRACNYNVVILIDLVPELSPRKYYFVVKLVDKHSSITVGVFDKHIDLQEFTLKQYAENIVNDIVYATNSLTDLYRSTRTDLVLY